MAIVVRPSARWVRAREMRTSVRASTDDVASSSTSTSGSATPARSRATSWRSPADSWSPRSPTAVEQTVGQPLDPVADVEPLDDRLHVGDRRARPGEADVGGDRVAEQERLLRHDDEPAAQLVVGHRVQRDAAEADLADRRVGEAGDQPAERRLARAGGADEGDLLAGRDVGVTWRSTALVDGRGEPPRRVGERHVADLDVERPGRQRCGSSGGGGPTGRSSTPSTRRSPATAVWVWSSTSVNSAIGSRKR